MWRATHLRGITTPLLCLGGIHGANVDQRFETSVCIPGDLTFRLAWVEEPFPGAFELVLSSALCLASFSSASYSYVPFSGNPSLSPQPKAISLPCSNSSDFVLWPCVIALIASLPGWLKWSHSFLCLLWGLVTRAVSFNDVFIKIFGIPLNFFKFSGFLTLKFCLFSFGCAGSPTL